MTIGRDILSMMLGEHVESKPLSPDPPSPSLVAELVGSYQFGPDFYKPNGTVRVHAKAGHLFDGRSFWLIPAGDMKFVNRVYWSDLEFLRDDSGKVYQLQYDSFVGVRKK